MLKDINDLKVVEEANKFNVVSYASKVKQKLNAIEIEDIQAIVELRLLTYKKTNNAAVGINIPIKINVPMMNPNVDLTGALEKLVDMFAKDILPDDIEVCIGVGEELKIIHLSKKEDDIYRAEPDIGEELAKYNVFVLKDDKVRTLVYEQGGVTCTQA